MDNKISDLFMEELSAIRNENVRNLVIYILDNKVPKYFTEKTALSSSSKKFHPLNKNGEPENLVEHTKSVFRVLYHLVNHPLITPTLEDIDELLASAILHDSAKYGISDKIEQEYTLSGHPLFIKAYCDDTILNNPVWTVSFDKICRFVSSHHGPWNLCKELDLELPPIETMSQFYLHLADFIASRTDIRVDYDGKLI